jgi:hypothetical protein
VEIVFLRLIKNQLVDELFTFLNLFVLGLLLGFYACKESNVFFFVYSWQHYPVVNFVAKQLFENTLVLGGGFKLCRDLGEFFRFKRTKQFAGKDCQF